MKTIKILIFSMLFGMLFLSLDSWADGYNKKSNISGSATINLEVGKINNLLVNSTGSVGRIKIGHIMQSNVTGDVDLGKIVVGDVENGLENTNNSSAKVKIGVIENSTVKDADIRIDTKKITNKITGGVNNHGIVRIGVIENSRNNRGVTIDISASRAITNTISGGSGNQSEVSLGVVSDNDEGLGKSAVSLISNEPSLSAILQPEPQSQATSNTKINESNQLALDRDTNKFLSQSSNNNMRSPKNPFSIGSIKQGYQVAKRTKNKNNRNKYTKPYPYYIDVKAELEKSKISEELRGALKNTDTTGIFQYLATLAKKLPEKNGLRGEYKKYLLNVYFNDPNRYKINKKILDQAVNSLVVNNNKYKSRIEIKSNNLHEMWSRQDLKNVVKNIGKSDPYYNLLKLRNSKKVRNGKGIYKLWKIEKYAALKKVEHIIMSFQRIRMEADKAAFVQYNIYHLNQLKATASSKEQQEFINNSIKNLSKLGSLIDNMHSSPGSPKVPIISVYSAAAKGMSVYNKTGDLERAMVATLKDVAPDLAGYASAGFYIKTLKAIQKAKSVSKLGGVAGLASGYLVSLAVDGMIYNYEQKYKAMINSITNVNHEKLDQYRKQALRKQLEREIRHNYKPGSSSKLSEHDLMYIINRYKDNTTSNFSSDFIKVLDTFWKDKFAPADII